MTFALVVATAFAVSAALPARASAGIGAPAIWSESPDYAPGDTVTLLGDGWGVGEVVHINVNDDAGQTWSRDVDVTADLLGNVTDQFTLPDWFVAIYTVTATAPSGTATATFTDGNVKARTNAAGFTFRLDWTRHNGTSSQPQPNCNAPVGQQTTGFEPAVGFGGGAQFSDGVPSDSSEVLEAADLASNNFVFIGWTGETPSDTFVARPDPHEICVTGDFTGSRTYVANYQANVPPTVAADNASRTVNEGQTATNSGTFGDANALDTVTLSASVGTLTQSGTHSGTWTWSLGTTDGPNESQSVTITATDNHGATSTTSFALTVNNVAPSIAISGAGSVNEGSLYSLTLGAVSDPGTDTVTSYIVHWGDGATDSYSSNGAKTHTYADGPASRAITVDLVDEDGSFLDRANLFSVTVNNVAPSIAISGAGMVNEGSLYSLTLGAVSDPGVDTVSSYIVHWGDGTDDTYSTNGVKTHTYADGPNDHAVTVDLIDEDGSFLNRANTFSVHVNNVPPTVTLTGASPVNEGSLYTYSYTTSDPGSEVFSRDAQSCDGGALSGATFSSATGAGSFECTYADGPSSHNPSVTISDGDGGSDSDSLAVTVNNVPPSIAISGAGSVNEGSLYSLTLGAVNDPGVDTVSSYVVHWGDGTDDTYPSNGAKTHTYADGPNDHAVTVDLIDEDGSYLNRANAHTVTVNNVAPSIAISGAGSVNEGSVYSLTLGAVNDPGVDTVTSYVVHWGDGTDDTYPSNGAKTHTYADGPASRAITVDLVDEDGSFLDRANPFSVTVDNVAPSIAISGAGSVNEGSSYSLTLGAVNDPGADTVTSYTVHWGDGTDNTYPSDGAKTHTYADGPASQPITIDLVDEDGSYLNRANPHTVTVNNVAPAANLTGLANVDEGSTHTYTFTVTDPGVDTFTVNEPTYPQCGTGGQYVTGSLTTNAGGGDFDCFFPNGPANTDVAIRVTDSDGASDTDSRSVQVVQVANVPPTVTAATNQSSDEGDSHSFSLGSFGDPGPDSPWDVSVAWGDGSPTTDFQVTGSGPAVAKSLGSKSHTYADGPNDYTVTVTVSDNYGDSDSDSFSVHVNNVAPSTPNLVSPADNATTSDATPAFDWSDSTDPAGSNDTITYTIQVDDSGCSFASPEINESGLSSSGFTPAADLADGIYCWRVRATDSDGENSAFSATRTLTIDTNDPPTANAGADVSGNEGSTIALNGSGSDPDDDPITFKWTYAPVSGVDAGATCSFAPNDTAEDPTITCTDDGTYRATLTVEDSKGATSSDDATVMVSNADPVVTAVNETPPPYAMGSTVVVSANFTDAGTNDTHRTPPGGNCTISWDDGSPSSMGLVTEANGSGSCSSSHVYSGPGVYTVTITVIDDDGGSGSATVQVVVYDPSAGFITGGGWVNVAPGSYPADPALTGRANFGFTSKYKKGASIPTGETEFNFQVADFRFHSASYQWLVVSGYKAQYKGTGEVNGAPGYDFRLTAYDGALGGPGNTGQDKFRIKITEHSTGAVVFDNRLGKLDDMDAADPQAISGGSIVIHKA
jgi:PKD domain